MGQTAFLVLLVAAIFSLLAPGLQRRLQTLLHRRPASVWAAPPLLTAVFLAASWIAGAPSLPLILMVLAYTAAPVLCAFVQGPAVARALACSTSSASWSSGSPSNSPPGRVSFRAPRKASCTAWPTASPSCSDWCCGPASVVSPA